MVYFLILNYLFIITMGNCHFKTDFDAENITGKLIGFIKQREIGGGAYCFLFKRTSKYLLTPN